MDKLVSQWKENVGYTDVDGKFMERPSNEQLAEKCLRGCSLVIYEASKGAGPWREMQEYPDHYRQTRICRKHAYARIYVTTGLHALNVSYTLKE